MNFDPVKFEEKTFSSVWYASEMNFDSLAGHDIFRLFSRANVELYSKWSLIDLQIVWKINFDPFFDAIIGTK